MRPFIQSHQESGSCTPSPPTSQGGGSGKASPDIHRGHRIPDAILICCVVKTFNRTEARAAIIATNDIDPVMEGHRGHVTSLTRDALWIRKTRCTGLLLLLPVSTHSYAWFLTCYPLSLEALAPPQVASDHLLMARLAAPCLETQTFYTYASFQGLNKAL